MTRRFILLPVLGVLVLASCKKDDNGTAVKPYTVPTTYNFANANFSASFNRGKAAEELRVYLNTAHSGTAVTTLDAAKINTLWNGLKDTYSNPTLIKAFIDSISLYNTNQLASQGTGGYLTRGANKIIVGPRGMEYLQGYVKGSMSNLFFKEAVRLLTEVKKVAATDTTKAQALWDEAFGNLSIPVNYDSSTVYASTDPNRPLFWGGYLAERGKPIQAGGTIFGGFLKGRAAIGGYDVAVRDAQADIIIAKWEQLSARAALVYLNIPTQSASVGVLSTQFHALAEAYGFIMPLQFRPATSKLTAANYETLKNIIGKDFYTLINQPGFADLVTAQNILRTTYGIEP